MEHDKAEQEWRQTRDRDRETGTPGLSKASGSGHATPNGKMDEVRPNITPVRECLLKWE
jgi:hypothetical protein